MERRKLARDLNNSHRIAERVIAELKTAEAKTVRISCVTETLGEDQEALDQFLPELTSEYAEVLASLRRLVPDLRELGNIIKDILADRIIEDPFEGLGND